MGRDSPAAGYQIQTRSSRLVPGTGAKVSTFASSFQTWITRSTAYGPVGAGRTRSDLRSSQRKENNPQTATLTNRASPVRLFTIQRDRAVFLLDISAMMGTNVTMISHDAGGTAMNAEAA